MEKKLKKDYLRAIREEIDVLEREMKKDLYRNQ